MKKHTLKEVQQIYKEHNYILLEKEYQGQTQDMKTECERHHAIFISNLKGVKRGNLYCPICKKEKARKGIKSGYRLDYNYIKEKFNERGYELLSKEYINSKALLNYKCFFHPNEDLWIDWNHFNKGAGCPFCSKYKGTSFPEQFILEIFKKVFKVKNRFHIDGKEYDFFIPEINCLIEYNGYFWHKIKDKTKRDKQKEKMALKNNYNYIKIIEVKDKILPKQKGNNFYIFYNHSRNKKDLEILINYILSFINFNFNKNIKIEYDYDKIKNIVLNKISKEKENSILKTIPNITKYWDYEKNEGILPNYFTHGSSVKIFLKCPDCGNKWKSSINDLSRKKFELCSLCAMKNYKVNHKYLYDKKLKGNN